jgi:hypothetical protein
MSDLVFTTQGQAEALAAQEAVAKKGREIRDEFEQGAKSVGAWDSAMSKLKGSAESALRSVATEQEKIAEQITKISAAQEKGLIPPAEAEAAVARLKDRWLECDEATKKQAEDAEKTANAHELLKESAEHAIKSVETEGEKTADQIKEIGEEAVKVQQAMKEGLVPKDVGEETVRRLKDKMEELKKPVEEVAESGGKMEHAFKHLFDPAILIKSAGAFVGIHAAIHLIKEELEDIQTRIDKRVAILMKPAERQKFLDDQVEEKRKAREDAVAAETEAGRALAPAADSDKKSAEQKQQEIAELEKDMARSKVDATQADRDAAQRRRELIRRREEEKADDNKHGKRAWENYVRNPGMSTQRELDDAKENSRKHREEFDRQLKADDETNEKRKLNDDRRAADQQQSLAKKRKELDDPAGASTAAMVAAAEASEKRRKAEEDLAAAQAEAAEHRARPETKEAKRLTKRGEALDSANRKAVSIHPSEHKLSRAELDKYADLMRELGETALEAKLRQSPEGTDESKVIASINEARQRHAPASPDLPGGGKDMYGVARASDPKYDEQERRTYEILTSMLNELRAIRGDGGGMTGGPE